MPVIQFPKDGYWKTMGNPETWAGGGFKFQGNERLNAARVTMLKVGTDPGASEFRLALFHDAACTNRYASSSWLKIGDLGAAIGALANQNWREDVTFTFPTRPWLDPSPKTYHLAVESQGYTRNLLAFYVAFMLDWPYPVNSPTDPTPVANDLRRGIKAEIYTERKAGFA